VAITSVEASTNQGFKSVVPFEGILSEYIFYYLKSSKNLAEERATGTTFKEISGSAFARLPIPIPPKLEQWRIVAKIEELFSELDKGAESLAVAREQLKVYRQAVLKHAFEGKLTADWRAKNPDKLETPEALLSRIRTEREAQYAEAVREWQRATAEWQAEGEVGQKPSRPEPQPRPLLVDTGRSCAVPSLPMGWAYFKVGSICDVVRGGSPRPAGDPRYYGGSMPFLKVADLTRSNGVRLFSHTYTITEAGLSKTRLTPPQTLLISNSGATLGVPKICTFETTFNDGIAAFLGLSSKELEFHYYFWESQTASLRAVNQGAAQPNLNTSILSEMPIPVCSHDETGEVVNRLSCLLSDSDSLLLELDRQIARVSALRQSILEKAFSGQLVPQDPNDEPASILLERIRAEKEKYGGRPKKSKKRDKEEAA
jgi:type I restriction enzyme S subunit